MTTWISAIANLPQPPPLRKAIVPAGVINTKTVNALLRSGPVTHVPKKVKNKVYKDLVSVDPSFNNEFLIHEPDFIFLNDSGFTQLRAGESLVDNPIPLSKTKKVPKDVRDVVHQAQDLGAGVAFDRKQIEEEIVKTNERRKSRKKK